MTLKEKIDSIDYSKIGKPEAIKSFVAKVEEKAKTSMTEAQALMDGILVKIQEKYPDAITKTIAPEKARAVISKLKKLKNIVPRKADYVKVADQIQKQQPNFTRQQAEELAKLRIEAQIARSTSFNDMINVLSKSNFYSGRLSTAPIDKGRGRDLQKDSNRGSITEADELKMHKKGYKPRKYKRISKAGHKNQYGTTSGGNVYYEYRDNRRDVDSKIRLAEGGLIGKEVEFVRYGEPKTGKVIEDLGNDRFAVSSGMSQILVKKENITKVIEPKKGRFFGLFNKGGKVTEEEIEEFVREYQTSREEAKQTLQRRKARLTLEENARLKQLQAKEDTHSLTPQENTEYEKLVHKYRGWKYVKGDGVEKFEYEIGQKFQDQYGDIYLLNKYSDGLWNARRWSGMRHVGDVVISEKDLDLIRTQKMAQGDLIQGRFQKHFRRGGNVKATYIPNASIKSLTTKYGSTIKGKDLLDGAYTTRKNVRLEPKVDRFMFEDEMYEYGKGGVPKYALGDVIDDADTPKVWVGEWSLYNEGKLIGEWVDLTRFDSGAEVMEYIQSLLEKWTKETGQLREEYAIFDYENFPSSLYSEQMGEESFDKVIQAYNFSKERDVPMEVVGTIVQEYGIDDLDEWFNDRYAGQFDSDTDLAYWFVDEMLGGIDQLDKRTQEMYFDYEAFGRDLAINDYREIDGYYFQAYSRGGMTKQSLNRYFKRK